MGRLNLAPSLKAARGADECFIFHRGFPADRMT